MVTTTRRSKPASAGASQAPAPGTPQPQTQQPQQQAPQQQAPQQQGTGFVNFSNIVAANRGGAQTMANRTAQQVRQAGTAGRQAIQGGQDTFAAATQAATLAYDPAKAPDKATATTLSQSRYEGPKTWEDAGVDVARASRLAASGQDQARALGTDGGRVALLRQNAPGALTGGGSALDAALMGQALGGEAQALGDEFGSLSQILADARGASGATYDAANAATRDAAARYGTLAGEYQSQADTQAAAAAQAERDRQARLRQEREATLRRRQQQDGGQQDMSGLPAYDLEERRGRARNRREVLT